MYDRLQVDTQSRPHYLDICLRISISLSLTSFLTSSVPSQFQVRSLESICSSCLGSPSSAALYVYMHLTTSCYACLTSRPLFWSLQPRNHFPYTCILSWSPSRTAASRSIKRILSRGRVGQSCQGACVASTVSARAACARQRFIFGVEYFQCRRRPRSRAGLAHRFKHAPRSELSCLKRYRERINGTK